MKHCVFFFFLFQIQDHKYEKEFASFLAGVHAWAASCIALVHWLILLIWLYHKVTWLDFFLLNGFAISFINSGFFLFIIWFYHMVAWTRFFFKHIFTTWFTGSFLLLWFYHKVTWLDYFFTNMVLPHRSLIQVFFLLIRFYHMVHWLVFFFLLMWFYLMVH